MAKETPKASNDCKCCKKCGNPYHITEKCDWDKLVEKLINERKTK